MTLRQFSCLIFGLLFGMYLVIFGYQVLLDKGITDIFFLYLFPLIILIAFSLGKSFLSLKYFLFSFIFIVLFLSLLIVVADKEEYKKIEIKIILIVFLGPIGNSLRSYLEDKKKEKEKNTKKDLELPNQ